MLCRSLHVVLLQLPDPVLDVLRVSSADELQVRHRTVAGRHNDQSPFISVFFFL